MTLVARSICLLVAASDRRSIGVHSPPIFAANSGGRLSSDEDGIVQLSVTTAKSEVIKLTLLADEATEKCNRTSNTVATFTRHGSAARMRPHLCRAVMLQHLPCNAAQCNATSGIREKSRKKPLLKNN
jgi:hypothetical protein